MRSLMIPVEGMPYVHEIPDSLDALQAIVGGLVESAAHDFKADIAVWINEEGLLLDLPVNEVASHSLPNAPIVGNVVITGHDGAGGNCDVPDEVVAAMDPRHIYRAMVTSHLGLASEFAHMKLASDDGGVRSDERGYNEIQRIMEGVVSALGDEERGDVPISAFCAGLDTGLYQLALIGLAFSGRAEVMRLPRQARDE